MKKLFTIFLILGLLLIPALALPITSFQVKADGLCDFLPCQNAGFCSGGSCADALTSTSTYIQLGVGLIFVGIIVLGIVVIIRAALKIIRSEGDEKKVQEGSENLRGVFFGVIIIFIGIIGVVIIISLFGATSIFNANPVVPTDNSKPLINIPTL
jgi:hypothetical protein